MLDEKSSPVAEEADSPQTHWAGQRLLVIGAATLVILAALYTGRELLVPIALAVLFWFLINAVANGLAGPPEARRLPMGLATVISALLFIVLIVSAGRIVASNAAELGQELYLENGAVIGWLRQLYEEFGLSDFVGLDQLSTRLPLGEYVTAGIAYMRGLLSHASLVVLYVLFLLLDQRFFDVKLRALVADDAKRADLSATLSRISAEARVYLWLMFLISLGVGGATFFFCQTFGVKGAAFWGFVAFVLNFIPTLGSIAAVVIPCLFALMTLDDPVMLGGLIAALAATQFIAGEIVLPRVMGQHLNLSSFVILLALVLWGMLWGPVGMFLAIPITVIFMSICARFPGGRPVAVLLSRDGRLPAS